MIGMALFRMMGSELTIIDGSCFTTPLHGLDWPSLINDTDARRDTHNLQ